MLLRAASLPQATARSAVVNSWDRDVVIAPHDALYWRLGGMMAIRKGDWKLVKTREGRLVDVGTSFPGTPTLETRTSVSRSVIRSCSKTRWYATRSCACTSHMGCTVDARDGLEISPDLFR